MLLPSVSQASETSLRTLLASQRARPHGPSITKEEEELVLAEIRGQISSSPILDHEWDGRPPAAYGHTESNGLIFLEGGAARYTNDFQTSANHLVESISSPSVFASSEGSSSSPTTWTSSPPPTSQSHSSFHTFDVNGDSNGNGVKIKSYGFSGAAGMRDGEYLRKVKKSSGGQHQEGSDKTTPPKQTAVLPTISAERANAWYAGKQHRPDSLEKIEGTAAVTPITSIVSSGSPASRLGLGEHSSPLSQLNRPPQLSFTMAMGPPTPDSGGNARITGPTNKRQSLLTGLSQAQMSRISMALGEIEGRLQVGSSDDFIREMDEENWSPNLAAGSPSLTSDSPSDQSRTPPLFAHTMLPTAYHFATTSRPETKGITSPLRLTTSPRSHNLSAQIEPIHASPPPQPILARAATEQPASAIHRPILSPSTTQPTRHMHTHSITSSSSRASPVPGYIPGQPRPVGAVHRSDVSMSPRSGTPVHRTGSPSSLISLSPVSRARSGSTPSPMGPIAITPRSSSLARSKSVSQGPSAAGPSRTINDAPTSGILGSPRSGLADLGDPNVARRLSSSMSMFPRGSAGIIEEGDETSDVESDRIAAHRALVMPTIKAVLDRRRVADSRPEAELDSQRATSMPPAGGSTGQTMPLSRSVSPEGFNDDSIESWNQRYKTVLRKEISLDSLSSGFAGPVFDEVQFTGSCPESPITPPQEERSYGDILWEMSGLGREEMSVLQRKLVERAKLEREDLRGGLNESPLFPVGSFYCLLSQLNGVSQVSPDMPVNAFRLPARAKSPSAPNASPASPAIWQPLREQTVFKSATPAVTQPVENYRSDFGPLFTPPHTRSPVADVRSADTVGDRRAPPRSLNKPVDTPSDNNDEIIFTPPSASVKQTAKQGQLPPEDDPEVRRDFEARIAAATAALNRTPSSGPSSQQEWKSAKRSAMVISSPQLTSSSTKASSTPKTPARNPSDPAMAKVLEKTSGSSGKMSLRWRKLGFRKASLASEAEAIPSPTASPRAVALRDKLEEPIALRIGDTDSSDLKAFSFPPKTAESSGNDHQPLTPASPPGHSGLVTVHQHMGDTPSRGSNREAADNSSSGARWPAVSRQIESAQGAHPGQPSAPIDLSALLPESPHVPTSSGESAIARFIAAGRVLGLNDEQLNDMLTQKGMLKRSGTTASSSSMQFTAPTSLAPSSPSPASVDVARMPLTEKGTRSLFRSLSKGMKQNAKSATSSTTDVGGAVDHNTVVRRTLLIPSEPEPIPQVTPQPYRSPNVNFDSPDLTLAKNGFRQRKLSVKRKPLNLTQEDRELVSSSPPAHKRQFSSDTAASGKSGNSDDEPVPEPAGLGFLHPNAHVDPSTSPFLSASLSETGGSSRGGSFYDYYNEDRSSGIELLESPLKDADKRVSQQTAGSSQAVEIW